MRVMVLMEKLYKASGNRCRFTFFNKDDFGSYNKLVWSFTKNWRYTQAVNDRLVFFITNAQTYLMKYCLLLNVVG